MARTMIDNTFIENRLKYVLRNTWRAYIPFTNIYLNVTKEDKDLFSIEVFFYIGDVKYNHGYTVSGREVRTFKQEYWKNLADQLVVGVMKRAGFTL